MGWNSGKADSVFERLGVFRLENLYEINCLKLMFKILNGRAPGFFEEIFVMMSGENRANSFILPTNSGAFLYRFPIQFLPKVWNSSGMGLRRSNSIHELVTLYVNNTYINYG